MDNDKKNDEQTTTPAGSQQPFSDSLDQEAPNKRKPSTREGLLDAIKDFHKRNGGKRYTLPVRRRGGDS